MRGILLTLLLGAIIGWLDIARAQVVPTDTVKIGNVAVLTVAPTTIDFGRVRVGSFRDSFFVVQYIDTVISSSVVLDSLNYQKYIPDSVFLVNHLPGTTLGTFTLDVHNSIVKDTVRFLPQVVGSVSHSITIRVGGATTYPIVKFMGTGVGSSAVSANVDFGNVHVGDSAIGFITVRNVGNDSTIVDSAFIAGTDTTFHLQSDSARFIDASARLAPRYHVPLQYVGGDTAIQIPVVFRPQKLGRQFVVATIVASPGDVFHQLIYDTLWGTGVEPLVTVSPDVIDLDTITVQASAPFPVDTFITIRNTGTFEGQLYSVHHTNERYFRVDSVLPSLSIGAMQTLRVTFIDTAEGDFTDTITINNDTRYALYGDTISSYHPIAIVHGSVRTGALSIPPHMFADTVRTCTTVSDSLPIHNPYPVQIQLDSIFFDSTGAGVSLSPFFTPPATIPPNGSFSIPIDYNFPPDSLNGTQQITVHYIRTSGELRTAGTAIVLVNRKRKELSLKAQLPSLVSSANDVSLLDLPITVEGPRPGIHELDAWTLTLTFSNDLFVPVALDTSSGLVTQHDTTPFSLVYSWDEATRTYTIAVRGAKLSDSMSALNKLLFKIRMRAFLTIDTEVTVTPVLKFVQYPCAYTLHPFKLTIPYANDCGDITVRGFMQTDTVPMKIVSVAPNPVQPSTPVSVRIDVKDDGAMRLSTFDGAGRIFGVQNGQLHRGQNLLNIPTNMLPTSGLAEVLVEAYSETGSLISRRAIKLAIQAP